MAGWGSAIKNTILFAITAIPGLYLYAFISSYAKNLSQFYLDNGNYNPNGQVVLYSTLSLLALIIGVGPMFFKFLSTTIEDGMIEF